MGTNNDLLARLQDALQKSRDKLAEQAEFIHEITAAPKSLGVVVASSKVNPQDSYRQGTRVMGSQGSMYQGKTGTIERSVDPDGVIRVRFDGGELYRIRVIDPYYRKPVNNPEVVPVVSKQSAVLVAVDGKVVEMTFPTFLEREVRSGDLVKVSTETMQILDLVTDYGLTGTIATFRGYAGKKRMMEVAVEGESRIVYPGDLGREPQKGDKILLDPFGLVAIENLGQDDKSFTFEKVHVEWSEIGGLEDAKAILREAIEFPVKHARLLSFYQKPPMKGAVLAGPPGTGKTLLGKAAATAMNSLYGNGGPSPFLYIKGPELLNLYVGNTEAAIRSVFERARRYQQKYGSSVLIFFDEAESLFRRRGSGISTDIFDTIVPMMLAEMDGFEATGAFVLLATNRLDLMDPAILRDGRINRVIVVPRPDQIAAEEIFRIHLKGKPIQKATISDLAKLGVNALFSPKMTLFEPGTPLAKEAPWLTLERIASGAMIAGIVDRATSLAINRDIARGARMATGICPDDIATAISQVLNEQKRLDHTTEIQEYVNAQLGVA